jgi:septum formation protein
MPAPSPIHRSNPQQLILASGSPYRAELLQRIRADFEAIPADVNESDLPDEAPAALAQRLARAKAQEIAGIHPAATIIGSDQVAALGTTILSKPGDHATAVRQLTAAASNEVVFYTAVHVCNRSREFTEDYLDTTRVRFRQLTAAEIESYVSADQPFDCAGSFRSEGLGITLFESLECNDPTALIGLPLIWLADCLRRAGYILP